MEDQDIIERQPKYTLRTVDNGSAQSLSISVLLPGVQIESEVLISFAGNDIVCRVPGKYRLVIPLPSFVSAEIEKKSFQNEVLLVELPIDADAEVTAPRRQPRCSATLDPSFAADALKSLQKKKAGGYKAKKKAKTKAKTPRQGQPSSDYKIADLEDEEKTHYSENLDDGEFGASAAGAEADRKTHSPHEEATLPSSKHQNGQKAHVSAKDPKSSFSENLRRGLAPKRARDFIQSSNTFVKEHQQAMEKQAQAFAQLDGELGEVLLSMKSGCDPTKGSEGPDSDVNAHPATTASDAAEQPASSMESEAKENQPQQESQSSRAVHAPDEQDKRQAPPASPRVSTSCPPRVDENLEERRKDDQMYADATRKANQEASMAAFELCMKHLQDGDVTRAVRLLKKACDLDSENKLFKEAYQHILEMANAEKSQSGDDTSEGGSPNPFTSAAPPPAASASANGASPPPAPSAPHNRVPPSSAERPAQNRGGEQPRRNTHSRRQRKDDQASKARGANAGASARKPAEDAPAPGPQQTSYNGGRAETSQAPPSPPASSPGEADDGFVRYGRTVTPFGLWILRMLQFAEGHLSSMDPESRKAKWVYFGVWLTGLFLWILRSFWEFGAETAIFAAGFLKLKRKNFVWLETQIRQPSRIQLAALSAAAVFNALVGGTLLWYTLRLCWLTIYWLGVAYWRGTFWVWGPLAALACFQKSSGLLAYSYPMILYWGLSGGWWSIGGTILAIALCCICLHAPLAFFCVYWIRCACIMLPFYMSVPATAAILLGWAAMMTFIEAAREQGSHHRRGRGSRGGAGGLGSYQPLQSAVPPGCEGTVRDVLTSENYYQVLSVGTDADEATIKKAKRALSLATHPDKTSMPGAKEAFQLVTDAADVLLDAALRSQYDQDMQTAQSRQDAGEHLDDEDDGDGSYFWFNVGNGRRVKARATKLPTQHWCSSCQTHHATQDGDLWAANTTIFFLTKTCYYLNVRGTVFDVTEWANAMGLGKVVSPGDHAPYRAPTGRTHTYSAPPKGRASRAKKAGKKKR